jgi:hypothetical protein
MQQMQQMQQMGQTLPFPPQLQHQMQASPIPQSQPQQGQQHMGMNRTPSTAMQSGARMEQPNNMMQSQQHRQNPQVAQLKMTPEDNEAIHRLSQQLAARTSAEDKRKIQHGLQSMPPEQLQNMKAKGIDPMAAYFRSQATKEWRRQQQGLGGNPNFTPNMSMTPATQAQRQGQTPVNMAAAPGNRVMSGNGQPGGTPFMDNIDHFQGLQADGLRSQQQGQLVVPASTGQGINPEQFRRQQFVNNQQLAKQNAGGRGPNQQFMPQQQAPSHIQQSQVFQQGQQDKGNDAASLQAQSQARARVEAAARARQQVGMQNQPGLQGMSQSGTPLTMLTLPMGANVQGPAPPPQQGTPQPRPPSRAANVAEQPTPQMQHNNAQIGQHNGNQPVSQPPLNLAQLPPPIQAILSKHPPSQWRDIMERMKQTAMRPSRFPPGAPPMSQTLSQPGQIPPMPTQFLSDGTMGATPMQHSISAGGSGTPASNQGMVPTSQPMMPQQRRQLDPNRPQGQQMPNQQVNTALGPQGNSLPDLTEQNILYMDQQPIPQQVYQNIVQKLNLPSQIKTWSHLKQYLAQNPHPGLPMGKILSVQKLQFHQMLQMHMQGRNRSQVDQTRPVSVQPDSGQQQQQALQAAPNTQNHPQQGPPQPNQMPMNVIGNLPPVTSQEIQRVRMSDPQFAQMPDTQIRTLLTAARQNDARKRLGLAQQQQNQQQFTFMPGQTPAQPPQAMPPRQQHPQPGAIPSQAGAPAQQTRPGMPGSRQGPMQGPRPVSQPAQPLQMPLTNQQQGKGVKRGGDDEVKEVPNPNIPARPGSQQHPAPGQPAAPTRVLSKEEVARLPLEQQKAYREKQNQHQFQMFQALVGRLTEEIRRSLPGLRPLAMDASSRARIVNVLTNPQTKQMLTRFNLFLYHYFLMTRNPDLLKQPLSHKMQLLPQYTSDSVKANTWEIAGQFSIGADYAETAVKDLLTRYQQVMSRIGPQPPVSNAPPPPEASGSHPLSADNLKKHQDMQAAQRAKRPAQEVPPAPTVSQPPFTFTDGSPRGGQGTPRYAPGGLKQGLKQEDLKLPSKRQKKTHQDTSALSPVANQPATSMSPQAVKMPKQDDLPFKCGVAGCEFLEKGFATKAELDNHSSTAHKPVEEHIDDPLAFFLESMRDGLGLDGDGQPKNQIAKAGSSTATGMQKTTGKKSGVDSKPPTPAPGAAAMARVASQASGAKAATPKAGQPPEPKPGAGAGKAAPINADDALWASSNVSLSDLHNTFGGLVASGPRTSLTHHDPLAPNTDIADFMDEFMESERWTKIQESAAAVSSNETPSSKATESPAQQSDRGQSHGDSDISKGDELFIKIGAEDTELAEAWALPELRIEGDGDGEGVEEWMNMEFGDAVTGDLDITETMDFEWKEVDWDKVLAEQEGQGVGTAKK